MTQALTVVALLVGTLPLSAQFHDLDLPVDSPAWWTLTDELSPAELRQAHRDPKASLERYLRDVEAGRARELSLEKARSLRFHVDGYLDPELVPCWAAFDNLATIRTLRFGSVSDIELLTDFAVSSAGLNQILEITARHRDLITEGYERLGLLRAELDELRTPARALGDDQETHRAVQEVTSSSNARFLVPLRQEAAARTSQLLEAVSSNVHFQASMITLPELRRRLDGDDWNAIRRFFLIYVAAPMSQVQGFEPLPEEIP